jgi:hypothetical protein
MYIVYDGKDIVISIPGRVYWFGGPSASYMIVPGTVDPRDD